MTMDLIGTQGNDCFTNLSWTQMLKIALQYGWQPRGTTPAEEVEMPDEADEPDERPEEGEKALSPSVAPQPVWSLAGLLESVGEDRRRYIERKCQRLFDQMERDDRFFSRWPAVESYFGNDGSRVAAEDARALAEALERALPDIPDHDALEEKTFTVEGLPKGVRCLRDDVDISPLEFYSGKNKKGLQDFIEFCGQGGFEIW